jgi:hypothetical protein
MAEIFRDPRIWVTSPASHFAVGGIALIIALRARELAKQGWRQWQASPDRPYLLVESGDELSEQDIAAIDRQGRAVGVFRTTEAPEPL